MKKNKYNYEEFVGALRQAIYQILPDHMDMEVHQVLKNNALQMDCLILYSDDCHASPNFYLQKLYRLYEEGEEITAMAEQIYEKWEETASSSRTLIENIPMHLEENAHRKRIIYRLINAKKNQEFLKDCPHIDFLDMALVFYYLFDENDQGIQSMRITNQLMDIWQTNVQSLLGYANQNMPVLFPVKYQSLSQMFCDTVIPGAGPLSEAEDEPYILTNQSWINGAAVWVYPGQFEKIAEQEQNSFYIIPSSIHELLIITDRQGIEKKELLKIIHMVNKNYVNDEDFLSDNLYFYDHKKKAVKIITVNND